MSWATATCFRSYMGCRLAALCDAHEASDSLPESVEEWDAMGLQEVEGRAGCGGGTVKVKTGPCFAWGAR